MKSHLWLSGLAAILLGAAPALAAPPPPELPRIETAAPAAVPPRVAPRTTPARAAEAPAPRIPATIRMGEATTPRAIVLPKAARGEAPVVVLHTASDQDAVHQELGPTGPLGAYGPLGVLGPIGKGPWNPSFWMRSRNWHEWSRWLTANGGPLSDNGPLSEHGSALSEENLKRLPDALRPGGEEAVVGPSGPLGPHGALGALGPMGAHGYAGDRDGNYRDAAGHVVRDVEVHFSHGTTARYELFEVYSKQAAMAMPDNDTSFMVNGAIETGKKDEFAFTSHSDQFVMVSVVPEKSLDNFGLEVRDAEGHVLAVADSKEAMNSVQVKVPAGTKLSASVFLNRTSIAQVLDHTYRLSVVGSENHTAPTAASSK